MSSSDSRIFEKRQISQPVRIAANVTSGADSNHRKNLSRNGTLDCDVMPSSDTAQSRTLSKLLPFSKSPNPIDGGLNESKGSCRIFSLNEVLKATNNYDDALVIGTGGFGKVYKGFIDNGPTMVAIKRLNAESKQGAREFWTEVKMLSKLRHTHLVALLGTCNEYQEMVLVYEYVTRGTLADHLYKQNKLKGNTSIYPLPWEQRLNICIGAARGLNHLHRGMNQSFIHRDVKTTNILIDENRVPKLSNFGLSKGPTSHSVTHISTEVKGTFGYFDPEYFNTHRLTAKSDVYAFGVVLLEVLFGRPPVDERLEEDQISLVFWAQHYIKSKKLDAVIDPSLSGQIAPRCLKSFVVLANNCLHKSPKSRPSMAEVLGSLELALIYQLRGRIKGIRTKTQSMMDRWLKEMKNISSSSGQSKDLLSSSEDPENHFKYIKAAAKIGQIEEVERLTRESYFYDPEKTKNFLMKAKLLDPRPLIKVCDRFGFVPDLIDYFYSNNMLHYIEGYVQKVNPGNAPLVVGKLLDDRCPEDFIKGLILSVRSQLAIEPLVEEFEKRNQLRLLTQFLAHLVNEGSKDVHVHNALGKIIIDSNNNPEQFLTTNKYYDSRVVGKYCEKRDPTLAAVAYCRGQCDDELINVTNKNALFKLQAKYVLERMDGDLWKMVLNPENKFRRQLIDHILSTESKSLAQVSVAVRAFMAAHLPSELIELLEKFVLQHSTLCGIFSLQKWRILMAIQALKDQQYTKAARIFRKLNWIPKRSKSISMGSESSRQ